MSNTRLNNRRTVLKTLGAGVVGGTVLTGSASASPSDRTDIYLRGHQFTPDTAHVSLGDDGSATVRWTNDEVNYFGKGYPIPHDVHVHHGEDHLVHSGYFVQDRYFDPDGDGPVPPFDLGPTFYEVEFREEAGDLVVEETAGKVKSTGFGTAPPIQLVEEYQQSTIEDWGGSVTLDVHCSLHSIALDVNEGELVTRYISSEETEPPYSLHLGFFKMEGGLKVTR